MANSVKYPAIPALARRGFTLIEVLIVVVIISILLTIAGIGIGNLTAGKNTAAAISTCEALFDEARTIAISKGCDVRVMIDVNDRNSDTYLRRVVISHQEFDKNGQVIDNQWVLASRGFLLPKGIYFSETYSRSSTANDIATIALSGTNVTTSYAGDYASYEFNSQGIFQDPGASFIIGSGTRGKNARPRVVKSSEKDFLGFVIWRNGRTSTFKNPDQMGIPSKPTTF